MLLRLIMLLMLLAISCSFFLQFMRDPWQLLGHCHATDRPATRHTSRAARDRQLPDDLHGIDGLLPERGSRALRLLQPHVQQQSWQKRMQQPAPEQSWNCVQGVEVQRSDGVGRRGQNDQRDDACPY